MNVQRLIKFINAGKTFDTAIFCPRVTITAAGNGSCTGVFKVDKDICDDRGFLAPSCATAIFDSLSSLGAMTLHNKIHVSVNIHMSYFRPSKLGEEIVVSSYVLKAGKGMMYLEGVFKNKDSEDVIAKGSHVKYVLDKNLYN